MDSLILLSFFASLLLSPTRTSSTVLNICLCSALISSANGTDTNGLSQMEVRHTLHCVILSVLFHSFLTSVTVRAVARKSPQARPAGLCVPRDSSRRAHLHLQTTLGYEQQINQKPLISINGLHHISLYSPARRRGAECKKDTSSFFQGILACDRCVIETGVRFQLAAQRPG